MAHCRVPCEQLASEPTERRDSRMTDAVAGAGAKNFEGDRR